jgi:hypothetical protein
MARTSGKIRKKWISWLNQGEGFIQGDRDILMYGTDYYKKLFGPGSGQIELHVEDLIHRAKLGKMFCL